MRGHHSKGAAWSSGYTRIPVYEKDPQGIIGILYTKDLILVDPGKASPRHWHTYSVLGHALFRAAAKCA